MTAITRDMMDFMTLMRRDAGDNPEALEMVDKDEIQMRGYKLLKKIGEGKTRDVYLAWYEHENVNEHRVVKVPKVEGDPNSFQTQVAFEKGRNGRNWNLTEILNSRGIQHPNVVRPIDSFNLTDGRTVNSEHYYEGSTDLETFVRENGPITDREMLARVTSGMVAGLSYLHGRGFLHRDFKPSNVIITKDGEVKITDLQTVATQKDIDEQYFPTRAGEAHTTPRILNATVAGDLSMATRKEDVYGLGTTVYYMLTGEDASPYHIVDSPNGREVSVGGRDFRIAIDDGNNITSAIAPERHEAVLKQMNRRMKEKKVPRQWRNFVDGCVRTEGPHFFDMGGVRFAHNRITNGFFNRLKSSITDGAKYLIPGLAAGALGGAIACLAVYGSMREHPPKLKEIMSEPAYKTFSLEDLAWSEENTHLERLVPAMRYAEKHLSKIESDTHFPNVEDMTRDAQKTEKMDPRLVSSWLRACYLCGNNANDRYKEESSRENEPRRTDLVFVPEEFVRRVMFHDRAALNIDPVESLFPQEKVRKGVLYLKQCLNPNEPVFETFARYFSGIEEINTARVLHGTESYFVGNSNPNMAGPRGGTGIQRYGYGSALPPHQQKLVDLATALYCITDDDGKVHFEKIPENTVFTGFDEEKYGGMWRY